MTIQEVKVHNDGSVISQNKLHILKCTIDMRKQTIVLHNKRLMLQKALAIYSTIFSICIIAMGLANCEYKSVSYLFDL